MAMITHRRRSTDHALRADRTLLWLVFWVVIPWVFILGFVGTALAAERECAWVAPQQYGVCATDLDEDGVFESTEWLHVSGPGTAYTTAYDTGDVLRALVMPASPAVTYTWTQDPSDVYPFPAVASWLCRPQNLTACVAP